jgi:anti-anti-sigma regulatory factor
MTEENRRATVTVTCDDVLDLSAAESMRERLLAAVRGGGEVDVLVDVQVVAAAVRQIDTANLQLLCAAARELSAQGRALRIFEPSLPFVTAARRLGLADLLGVQGVDDHALPATTPPLTP